jgi:hypothetical protein
MSDKLRQQNLEAVSEKNQHQELLKALPTARVIPGWLGNQLSSEASIPLRNNVYIRRPK